MHAGLLAFPFVPVCDVAGVYHVSILCVRRSTILSCRLGVEWVTIPLMTIRVMNEFLGFVLVSLCTPTGTLETARVTFFPV